MREPAPAGAFTLPDAERREQMLPVLLDRVAAHRRGCPPYDRILSALGFDARLAKRLEDVPPIPVELFKKLDLRSVPAAEVASVLRSSGTTGTPSRVHLDRDASLSQQRALATTLGTVLGHERLPMLIVESPHLLTSTTSPSARGAGVVGLMPLGRDHVFALDEAGRPDIDAICGFLAVNGREPFLIFGFTFVVWTSFYEPLRGFGLDLSQGVLLHSGGWKKMTDRQVSDQDFRHRLGADMGLTRIHNFYGMAEQIGVVHLEGRSGTFLYAPDFAEVVVRDPSSLEPVSTGTPGLIEVISTLPTSYPGNALLTQDIGVVHGVDDGEWPGPRFTVLGRLPLAEPRGCSDTFGELGDDSSSGTSL